MTKTELAAKVFEAEFHAQYNAILAKRLSDNVAAWNVWITVACIVVAVLVLMLPFLLKHSDEHAVRSTAWYRLADELHQIGLNIAYASDDDASQEHVTQFNLVRAKMNGIESSECQLTMRQRPIEEAAQADAYQRMFGVRTREAAADLKKSNPEMWNEIHYLR